MRSLTCIFFAIAAISNVDSVAIAHTQDDKLRQAADMDRPTGQRTAVSASQNRALIVQHNSTNRKQREASYTAEDYEYKYDYEYEDSPEEDEKTFLERMDSKLTKKYIITVAIVFNVCACVLCTCCLCCCTCCKEGCTVLKRNCLEQCDRMCLRDAKYRKVQESFRRMDLKPPTYDEYKELRDSAGIDKNIMC